MKCYLYIIQSLNYSRYYIGITVNLSKRLIRHNNGLVRSTKAYIPWKLVYKEEHDDKTNVRKREIFLKNNYQARKKLFDKITAPSSSLV